MTGDVMFEDGVRGEILPKSVATLDANSHICVRLEDGRQIIVSTDLLALQVDKTYAVPFSVTDFPNTQEIEQSVVRSLPLETEIVVPVTQEFVGVEKRLVETGRVRVIKTVTSREEVVDEPLTRTMAEIERIPVGCLVNAVPEARQEGDTLIIAVVKEVLVVEKRLMLVEEVRVTQRQSEYRSPQTVTLRQEEVSIEHLTHDNEEF